MNPLKITGIVLIILGVVMFFIGGFSYKEKKKVLDTDVIDISAKRTKTVSWPPIVGTIVVLGGIVVFVMGTRRT